MIIFGVITARRNSQRLPGKNMMSLGNKPLIQWTMEAAIDSFSFNHILCSTDDPDIRELCYAQGVNYLHRPDYLCTDRTPHLPVIYHAVEYMKIKDNYEPDAVFILQPTSPFRDKEDIQQAINIMEETDCDTVVGMEKGKEKYNGAVYLFKTKLLFSKTPTFYGKHVVPMLMNEKHSVNIDTLSDFNKAESLL